MTMNLTQQDNQLIVNGFLKSKNIQHITYNDNDAITGYVDIAFKDGKKHNVQRLSLFAPEKTKAGKENPSYKSISKVESDYIAAEDQPKNPDRVHVTGQLDYNIFETNNGDLVKTMRKNASFFTRIKKDDKKYKNEARAHVILTVTGYEDEVKKGTPTGNKIVHNLNIGYGNRVNVIPNLKFNMKSLGNDIDTIVDTFPIGSTMDTQIVFGDYAVVNKTKQQAHGFGHHEQMSVATKFVHNAEIDYIEAQPVSETAKRKQALTKPQIKHAKDLLKQKVQQVKDKNSSDKNNPFNDNKNTKKKISDDDLPF